MGMQHNQFKVEDGHENDSHSIYCATFWGLVPALHQAGRSPIKTLGVPGDAWGITILRPTLKMKELEIASFRIRNWMIFC